jgi:hypothetical protein
LVAGRLRVVFAVMVAAEQALSVVATVDRPDLGTIEARWVIHDTSSPCTARRSPRPAAHA